MRFNTINLVLQTTDGSAFENVMDYRRKIGYNNFYDVDYSVLETTSPAPDSTIEYRDSDAVPRGYFEEGYAVFFPGN